MAAFYEGKLIETSGIVYSKTGIRLTKFVTEVYGHEVLEKIKKGELSILFNSNEIRYSEKFHDHRVKEHIEVNVWHDDTVYAPIPEDMFL